MVPRLIALILPLGLDTFAVAAALGAIGTSGRSRLRISVLFMSFEAGMPLIGLALGSPLGHAIGSAADFLAIAVLLGFGTYMLLGDEDEAEESLGRISELRPLGAVALGLSVSLDELAIGFTLGLLKAPVVLVVALIAIQALIVSQLGLRVGHRLSERLREGAERLAGLALALLGLVLLGEKLLG